MGGQWQQENTNSSKERGMRTMNWVQDFCAYKGITSAAKRVHFVSDRMSYIILRGRWCHIIVLNVHVPTEYKTNDVKDSFSKTMKRVFDKFC
jgi:hypothetical protein